jgi:nucleoside-diphosphate-sugar epimerase
MKTSRDNPLSRDLDEVLERTRGIWASLNGARIFITGGTGLYGCWLLETLLRANERLGADVRAVVLTRDPDAFRKKSPRLADGDGVTLQRGDVVDFDFPQGGFDCVVHAAGILRQPGQPAPYRLMREAVDGTIRVLDFARAAGVRRMLLTSSGAVYGPGDESRGRIREDSDTGPLSPDPQNVYAEAKRACEMLCRVAMCEGGPEVAISRGFAVIGPGMPLETHMAAGSLLRDAQAGGPLRILGDGRTVRSYLYCADLAEWLWTILVNGGTGTSYNVGSDRPVTVAALASAVSERFEPAPRVEILGRSAPGSRPDYYVPDISRAREELGLEVRTGFEDALDRTIAFLRQGY